jgi:hypothetical protein
LRPVITIMPKPIQTGDAVDNSAHPGRDPEISRVLSIIEGKPPTAATSAAQMPQASSMWSESLDLIEQLGRSAREGRERIRTLEAQLQLIVRESASQISAARERIASLEDVVHKQEEREAELKGRLDEAERWLHLIQDALRIQAAPELEGPTAPALDHGDDPRGGSPAEATG